MSTTESAADVIRVGAIATGDSLQAYDVLAEVARRLREKGHRLAGVVRAPDEAPLRSPCDMTLEVLPDGPRIGIAQDLGAHAQGCRLDTEALESAVGLVDRALDAGADVLVLNKFGKAESEGGGFRQTIARAVSRGIPVLMAVGPREREALEAFVGDPVDHLARDPDAVLDWLDRG